jgi:hypothetical protein
MNPPQGYLEDKVADISVFAQMGGRRALRAILNPTIDRASFCEIRVKLGAKRAVAAGSAVFFLRLAVVGIHAGVLGCEAEVVE